MLFLGAGASNAFGIGDLTDWTRRVDAKLIKLGYNCIKKHILRTLTRANNRMDAGSRYFANNEEIDLEVIMSVIDFLLEPSITIQHLGPVAIYLNELKKLSKYYDSIQRNRKEIFAIRNTIENTIVDSCNEYDIEAANNYYHNFFLSLNNLTTSYVNAAGASPRIQLLEHVATTNYDLILERYDVNVEFPERHFLRRGFSRGGYCWNEPYLDLHANDAQVEYLKLHGSIDWWLRVRDKKVVPRECTKSLMGELYRTRSMLYPIYEKHVTLEPYASLYGHFRQWLSRDEVYIVIGYSFRDPSINNAFRDALTRTAGSRLILINRSPDRIMNRIRNFPADKIDVIGIEFGHEDLIEELGNILQTTPEGL
jgi:hypothetical protein